MFLCFRLESWRHHVPLLPFRLPDDPFLCRHRIVFPKILRFLGNIRRNLFPRSGFELVLSRLRRLKKKNDIAWIEN